MRSLKGVASPALSILKTGTTVINIPRKTRAISARGSQLK